MMDIFQEISFIKWICILCTAITAYFSSYYYHLILKKPFDRDIAFGAVLLSIGLYCFMLVIIDWELKFSLIAAIAGGIIFTHRAS